MNILFAFIFADLLVIGISTVVIVSVFSSGSERAIRWEEGDRQLLRNFDDALLMYGSAWTAGHQSARSLKYLSSNRTAILDLFGVLHRSIEFFSAGKVLLSIDVQWIDRAGYAEEAGEFDFLTEKLREEFLRWMKVRAKWRKKHWRRNR